MTGTGSPGCRGDDDSAQGRGPAPMSLRGCFRARPAGHSLRLELGRGETGAPQRHPPGCGWGCGFPSLPPPNPWLLAVAAVPSGDAPVLALRQGQDAMHPSRTKIAGRQPRRPSAPHPPRSHRPEALEHEPRPCRPREAGESEASGNRAKAGSRGSGMHCQRRRPRSGSSRVRPHLSPVAPPIEISLLITRMGRRP